jgi:hypothetical protein
MDLRHDLTVVRQNGRGLDAGRNALLPLGSSSVLLGTFTSTLVSQVPKGLLGRVGSYREAGVC